MMLPFHKPEPKWVFFAKVNNDPWLKRPFHRDCTEALFVNSLSWLLAPCNHFKRNLRLISISSPSFSLLGLYCRPIRCEREGKWIVWWPRSHWCKPPSAQHKKDMADPRRWWTAGLARGWTGCWRSSCSCREMFGEISACLLRPCCWHRWSLHQLDWDVGGEPGLLGAPAWAVGLPPAYRCFRQPRSSADPCLRGELSGQHRQQWHHKNHLDYVCSKITISSIYQSRVGSMLASSGLGREEIIFAEKLLWPNIKTGRKRTGDLGEGVSWEHSGNPQVRWK